MPITLSRSTCRDLNETISREWLLTNGRGGYAAGTVAGVLTRMQQGLLVAQPPDATVPQLLLAKIDEEVVFDQRTYYLGTNEYRDGTLSPSGFVHLEHFRLEEGFPVFTYHLGGINGMMLEKRIWMPQDAHTTYIQYRVLRTSTERPGYRRSSYGRYSAEAGQGALSLTLLPLSGYRPHNQTQQGEQDLRFQVEMHNPDELHATDEYDGGTFGAPRPSRRIAGCTIRAKEDAHPYHILAVGHPHSQVTFIPTGVWYWNFLHRHDAAAGYPATDDLYLPGVIRATLWPDEDATLTIVASAEELSALRPDQIPLVYRKSVERQHFIVENALQPERFFGDGGEAARAHHLHVLPLSSASETQTPEAHYLNNLLLGADHFLIRRSYPQATNSFDQQRLFGTTMQRTLVLASPYTAESYTRDALIALPGLMLVPERFEEALGLLRHCTLLMKGGMLPDRLPLPGQSAQDADYGNVDTTLWFFYALDAYLRVTRNYEFLADSYSLLTDSINRYIQGTDNGIRLDPSDGLLRAEQSGRALTWMNAFVHGHPVTPRAGKPVEVNALWYNALALMRQWSEQLSHLGHQSQSSSYYQDLLTQCRESFQKRFWYAAGGYLYDVVDGPEGDDTSIRPNQLLAFSLRHPVLAHEYRSSVFDVVTRHLLTPSGLRTLSPQARAYRGRLKNSRAEQQEALHQGSAWVWLLGPYIDAMLALRDQDARERSPEGEGFYREHVWQKSLQALEPLARRFSEGLLGVVEGVFDGDIPQRVGLSEGYALSQGELLRSYNTLAQFRATHPLYALSV